MNLGSDIHKMIMEEVQEKQVIKSIVKDMDNKQTEDLQQQLNQELSQIVKSSLSKQLSYKNLETTLSIRNIMDGLRLSSVNDSFGNFKEDVSKKKIGNSKEFLLSVNKNYLKDSNQKYVSETILGNKGEDEMNMFCTPDQDFLLDSADMENKFASNMSEKEKGEEDMKYLNVKRPTIQAEALAMSDYYDNVFNSFLGYTNSYLKNPEGINKSSHNNSFLRKSTNDKKIDVSAGLSMFLKSKIDSFIEDYQKDNNHKKITAESMIRKNNSKIMKSELGNIQENKDKRSGNEAQKKSTNELFQNRFI